MQESRPVRSPSSGLRLPRMFRLLPPVACLLLLAVPQLRAVDNLTISSTTTYSTTQTVSADNSITTSATVTVGSSADVTYTAGAHVSLGAGFSVASGGLFHVQVGQSLPYVVGFESADNFSTGSLGGQRGWIVAQGSADVTTSTYQAGARGVALNSGGTAAKVSQGFLESGSPSVTFIDLYFAPVAAGSASASTVIETESARIGFQISGGQGEIYSYDGVGSNTWVDSHASFPINGSNQSTNWLHLTIREDYTHHTWDLYLDGQLIDYDLAFSNTSEAFFRQLTINGVTAATAYLDTLAVQSTNPLFTDADKDGMPDSWETANGLNTAADDRNSDHDSDGVTNIEEYFAGTAANNADTTHPTAATALSAMSTSASVTLNWTAGTDSGAGTSGVAGYNVYRNGAKVNSSLVTSTTYTDSTVSPSTTYSYTVRTVDLAGNVSTDASVSATTSATGSFEVFTPLL